MCILSHLYGHWDIGQTCSVTRPIETSNSIIEPSMIQMIWQISEKFGEFKAKNGWNDGMAQLKQKFDEFQKAANEELNGKNCELMEENAEKCQGMEEKEGIKEGIEGELKAEKDEENDDKKHKEKFKEEMDKSNENVAKKNNTTDILKDYSRTNLHPSAEEKKELELPRKAANPWKPKRLAPPKDEEEQKYDNLRMKIRGLLNKITHRTFDDCTKEFCEHEIYKDSKLLTIIVDLIFDKAVEEPNYCPIYSDLCKKQVMEEWEKGSTKFWKALLNKCQNSFLASKEYGQEMEELEIKLNENELDKSDEKGKKQIKEEQEMRRFKQKRHALGYMKFVGQLYCHSLLMESIIKWCLNELFIRFNKTHEEAYLEYIVELTKTIGKTYEEKLEKNAIKQQQEAALYHQQKLTTMAQKFQQSPVSVEKDFVKKIISELLRKTMPIASNRIRFAIMDLEELQRRNWIKRGGE